MSANLLTILSALVHVHVFYTCIYTLQKRDGLLRLSQLQLNVTPTLSSYFSYALETDGMWVMCRVSSINT